MDTAYHFNAAFENEWCAAGLELSACLRLDVE
jgi:hypothetical protein